MAEMNPQKRRAVIILVIVLILGGVGFGLWKASSLGSANANKAKAQSSAATTSPSPSSTPASGTSTAAAPSDGTVLAATTCEDCANAYGQISLGPGNSLSRLPRQLMYGAGGWADTTTFTMSWKMAGSGNNRVTWKSDDTQGAHIDWRRAYLVSFKGDVTEVDLRDHPAELIFKMGAVRDVAIYGVFVSPAATTGPVPAKSKPTLP